MAVKKPRPIRYFSECVRYSYKNESIARQLPAESQRCTKKVVLRTLKYRNKLLRQKYNWVFKREQVILIKAFFLSKNCPWSPHSTTDPDTTTIKGSQIPGLWSQIPYNVKTLKFAYICQTKRVGTITRYYSKLLSTNYSYNTKNRVKTMQSQKHSRSVKPRNVWVKDRVQEYRTTVASFLKFLNFE